MRVHLLQNRMTFEQADTLLYYLSSQKLVTGVKVREKTQDATINFVGDREEVIRALKAFHYETAKVPEIYLKNSGRELQNEYWEKLVNKVSFITDYNVLQASTQNSIEGMIHCITKAFLSTTKTSFICAPKC